jgi:hypothetical protein
VNKNPKFSKNRRRTHGVGGLACLFLLAVVLPTAAANHGGPPVDPLGEVNGALYWCQSMMVPWLYGVAQDAAANAGAAAQYYAGLATGTIQGVKCLVQPRCEINGSLGARNMYCWNAVVGCTAYSLPVAAGCSVLGNPAWFGILHYGCNLRLVTPVLYQCV